MRSTQTIQKGVSKINRPFANGSGHEPKDFPTIRETFRYRYGSEPKDDDLNTWEQTALLNALGKREDFEELLWTVDEVRSLIHDNVLNIPGQDKESANYQKAVRCFHALNGLIGALCTTPKPVVAL